MLAAQIDDRHASLVLLQNPDDLLFRKATTLYALVLLWARTNFKLDYVCGARSPDMHQPQTKHLKHTVSILFYASLVIFKKIYRG
jgi:hypothetical protein